MAFADAGLNDVVDAIDIMIGITDDEATVTAALDRYGIEIQTFSVWDEMEWDKSNWE